MILPEREKPKTERGRNPRPAQYIYIRQDSTEATMSGSSRVSMPLPAGLRGTFEKAKKNRPALSLDMINLDLCVPMLCLPVTAIHSLANLGI